MWGLTGRSTGRYTACRHLGYKILAQIPSICSAPVSYNVSHHPKSCRSSSVAQREIQSAHKVKNSERLVPFWKAVKSSFARITAAALQKLQMSKHQRSLLVNKSHVYKSSGLSMTILAFCGRLESCVRSLQIQAMHSTGIFVYLANPSVPQAITVRPGNT